MDKKTLTLPMPSLWIVALRPGKGDTDSGIARPEQVQEAFNGPLIPLSRESYNLGILKKSLAV
ncbi:MAG: hypothetical protein RDV48_11270 [Candidatus Eremiobacteraeota bacterium]|nr:hypothetical protein [Candidatus Eremiobacteraeota bacterium]